MGKAPSDYNDLKNKAGLSVVKKQIDAAVDAEKGIPYSALPFRVMVSDDPCGDRKKPGP